MTESGRFLKAVGDLMKNNRFVIRILIFLCIAAVPIAAIAYNRYKDNVYPYQYAKEYFEQNEDQFSDIALYFADIGIENIRTAYMRDYGYLEISMYNSGFEKIDVYSDSGFQAYKALRDEYDSDSDNTRYQEYMLGYVDAEYEKDGDVFVSIPVYVRELEWDGDVDAPNKVLYYIAYYDEGYELDSSLLYFSEKYAVAENWFVYSRSSGIG